MKAIPTGGTGALGRRLAAYLASRDVEVVVLTSGRAYPQRVLDAGCGFGFPTIVPLDDLLGRGGPRPPSSIAVRRSLCRGS